MEGAAHVEAQLAVAGAFKIPRGSVSAQPDLIARMGVVHVHERPGRPVGIHGHTEQSLLARRVADVRDREQRVADGQRALEDQPNASRDSFDHEHASVG